MCCLWFVLLWCVSYAAVCLLFKLPVSLVLPPVGLAFGNMVCFYAAVCLLFMPPVGLVWPPVGLAFVVGCAVCCCLLALDFQVVVVVCGVTFVWCYLVG